MPTILLLLLLLALIFTIGAAAGRLPLWPAVLLLVLAALSPMLGPR